MRLEQCQSHRGGASPRLAQPCVPARPMGAGRANTGAHSASTSSWVVRRTFIEVVDDHSICFGDGRGRRRTFSDPLHGETASARSDASGEASEVAFCDVGGSAACADESYDSAGDSDAETDSSNHVPGPLPCYGHLRVRSDASSATSCPCSPSVVTTLAAGSDDASYSDAAPGAADGHAAAAAAAEPCGGGAAAGPPQSSDEIANVSALLQEHARLYIANSALRNQLSEALNATRGAVVGIGQPFPLTASWMHQGISSEVDCFTTRCMATWWVPAPSPPPMERQAAAGAAAADASASTPTTPLTTAKPRRRRVGAAAAVAAGSSLASGVAGGLGSGAAKQGDGLPREGGTAEGHSVDAQEVMSALRTTVMMRNIPNNYSREMLLAMLGTEGFSGLYDFLYMPIDFRSRSALGYAFVNLTDLQAVQRFWAVFDGFSRWSLPTKKVSYITWCGPHQGFTAHVERYRNSPVMHTTVPDAFKPVAFSGGVRVEFPPPTKTIRAPRLRDYCRAGPPAPAP